MRKSPPSIYDLSPIDRATLIAAMKYLIYVPWDPTIEELSDRYQMTKAKTEKLLNFGMNLDFIEIKMDNCDDLKLSGAKEYRRFLLTEEGKNFLDQNLS